MIVKNLEGKLGGLAFLSMVGILSSGFLLRPFGFSLPGADDYVVHLVLLVGILSGVMATIHHRHLTLRGEGSTTKEEEGTASKCRLLESGDAVGGGITLAYTIGSISLLLWGFDPEAKVGVIPLLLFVVVIPAGFASMTYHFFRSAWRQGKGRGAALVVGGVTLGLWLSLVPLLSLIQAIFPALSELVSLAIDKFYTLSGYLLWPLFIGFLFSAVVGAPIFAILGGCASVLLAASGVDLTILPGEVYSLLTEASIPAIPLFTLAGFLLSESRSGERLIQVFNVFLGGTPGGVGVVAVLVCAFFTTFTGASGVTILALGGILFYMMEKDGSYSRRFSTGLLTSSGSVGLLFPPSLPVILYGVMAHVNIRHLFIGGVIPGVFLVLSLATFSITHSLRGGKKRRASLRQKRAHYSMQEKMAALKGAMWELFLPIVVLFFFLNGVTTLTETAAFTVLYVMMLEMLIHRDILWKDLEEIFKKSLPIVGGILTILAVSKGLSFYIIDASIPEILTTFVQHHVENRYVFLALLNVVLLITGCLMDVFSAILVVGPLVLPVSTHFGVDPVHLGIIFLANLELGYLTPPVGMQLFLASYRFKKPIFSIYRSVLPFFLLMLGVVLLITYVPSLSLGLLGRG